MLLLFYEQFVKCYLNEKSKNNHFSYSSDMELECLSVNI